MGIVPTFSSGVISEQVVQFKERLEGAMVFLLKYMGESLARYARDHHSYTDRTGNLTNSIGYAVVRGKEIVYYGGSNQPGAGSEEALKTAMKMAATLTSQYSLIVVAGMNYAAYVEAKGYNVILPAELKAKTDFPAAMQKLKATAQAKANELFGNVM